MDPRVVLIENRLRKIKRIISISSGKGGVGKSVIATTLALALSKLGRSVGLLDLDFYGPSCTTILGAKNVFPREEKGLIPPKVSGVYTMSIEYFTREKPLPIRGFEATDAMIEILAITRWGELDYLVIDMPPGLGDEILDLLRFIPRAEHIAITTPSKLSINVVKKLIELLKKINSKILGLIVNMVRGPEEIDVGITVLGKIRFDPELENAIGEPKKILETDFGKDVLKIVTKIFS